MRSYDLNQIESNEIKCGQEAMAMDLQDFQDLWVSKRATRTASSCTEWHNFKILSIRYMPHTAMLYCISMVLMLYNQIRKFLKFICYKYALFNVCVI